MEVDLGYIDDCVCSSLCLFRMHCVFARSSRFLEKAYRIPKPRTNPLSLRVRSYAISMPSKTDDKYTDPELREQVKEEIQAGDKGGAPGQWSARKVCCNTGEYYVFG